MRFGFVFGALAVIIAAVGIAGVLAFSVSARTNEIGIRMSLGADSASVQRMVSAEGGTCCLLIGAGGRGRPGRHAADPRLLSASRERSDHAGIRGIDDGAGRGVACWLPALRAARIDPAVAIRRR